MPRPCFLSLESILNSNSHSGLTRALIESFHPRLDFKKANFSEWYVRLANIDWSFLKFIGDVEQAYSTFTSILFEPIRDCVPLYKCNSSQHNKYLPWFSKSLLNDISIKDNLLKWDNLHYISGIRTNKKNIMTNFWKFVNSNNFSSQQSAIMYSGA